MASSPVEISNSALALLGEDAIISFDDPRTAARLLSVQYDAQRKLLIRSYRWNFAMELAILAPEVDAPLFGFAYKFLLPADYLKVVGVYDANSQTAKLNYTGSDVIFKTVGRYIQTDVNPLYLYYLKDISNPVEMDAIFVEALAAQIAMKLAMPLTNDLGKFQLASNLFKDLIKAAKSASAIENTPEMIIASDWIDARFSGNGSNGRFRLNN